MTRHAWDRDEMIAHAAHLEGLTDHLRDATGPGVGRPEMYGSLVGEKLHPTLYAVANALTGSIDALTASLSTRRRAVEATVRIYSANESENTAAAQQLIDAIEGDDQ